MSDLRIVFEDNHLLVVNKNAGIPVQSDSTGDLCLVDQGKEYLRVTYNKLGEIFCGLVHRIDRPVSGAVILAKTSKALSRMNEEFKNRNVHKTYWAIVKNEPPTSEGTLINWLKKDPRKLNFVIGYKKEVPDSQLCELHYKVIKKSERYFLLEINPITGRQHQIRVQLAMMGCPIVGDLKYGYDRSNADASICLHARRLDFIHPVKKEPITLEAELPTLKIWHIFA